MTQQIPGAFDQRERLKRFLEFATDNRDGYCNFGAMLIVSRPGDVDFLAPIAPELRGIEIVSASPSCEDGKDYDIWRHGKMIRSDLTMAEILEWLRSKSSHSEAEYTANGAAWAEDALRFYGIKPRR